MPESLDQIPTLEQIRQTQLAISAMVRRTPVLSSETIDSMCGARLFFKCENFQKVGAFKMRGAASAALRLTEAEKAKGLATHSSGNHAQAVARAASLLKIPAYIVMPDNAPAIKQAATRGYGAEIIFCESSQQAREAALEDLIQRTGATFIHPYDDYNIIAGQATAAAELIAEVEQLDMLIAPVGGGGLISGTALAAHYLLPDAKVIGAEPAKADDAYRSLASGVRQSNASANTIADGLRTHLGEKNFAIMQKYVDEIITVTEEQIVAAMRLIWERMKIVIEPSAAVPLAAVWKQQRQFAGSRIGIILTGGNIELSKLPF